MSERDFDLKQLAALLERLSDGSHDHDRLVGCRDAAGLLGMSEWALRKAVQRRQVHALRIGSRVHFRRGDLLELASA
jgi:hypothetical protein